MAIRFPTASQIHLLHRCYILPAQATQPALLHSAIASPQQHMHYDSLTDIFQLAAILAQKVARNHAFQDGNKRTSLLAADAFLRMNGWRLGDVEVVRGTSKWGLREWHVGIACGEVEWEELATYYSETAQKFTDGD